MTSEISGILTNQGIKVKHMAFKGAQLKVLANNRVKNVKDKRNA